MDCDGLQGHGHFVDSNHNEKLISHSAHDSTVPQKIKEEKESKGMAMDYGKCAKEIFENLGAGRIW